MRTRPKRLLYVVNHRTLTMAEVPIFRDLGYEVFIPKVIPGDERHFRSGEVTYEYDTSLTCSASSLAVLNAHNFYQQRWGSTLKGIVNQEFDTCVLSISGYIAPLAEAVASFHGLVIARVFGREHPTRHADFIPQESRSSLLSAIENMGDRFVFAQGYENLAEIEPPSLGSRAQTVTVPLPEYIFTKQDSWVGNSRKAIFLCPGILETGYYRDRYEEIKAGFGDLPHQIFGKQVTSVDDVAVMAYLSDDQLLEFYAAASVLVYPSVEPRHVHYSPIEAMVVGTPVLYRRGAMIDILAGEADLPGACTSVDELRRKAKALIGGDRLLANEIRSTQRRIVDEFRVDVARAQWENVLAPTVSEYAA